MRIGRNIFVGALALVALSLSSCGTRSLSFGSFSYAQPDASLWDRVADEELKNIAPITEEGGLSFKGFDTYKRKDSSSVILLSQVSFDDSMDTPDLAASLDAYFARVENKWKTLTEAETETYTMRDMAVRQIVVNLEGQVFTKVLLHNPRKRTAVVLDLIFSPEDQAIVVATLETLVDSIRQR